MAEDQSQKTEKPTPKRLHDTRKRGQIPKSVDLVQWVSFLAATYVLPWTVGGINQVIADGFGPMVKAASTGEAPVAMQAVLEMFAGAALALVPLFALIVAWTIAGMAVQGGVVLTGYPLKPQWNRVSPKAGLKRLVSAANLNETLKSVIRLGVLALLISTTFVAAVRDRMLVGGLGLAELTEGLVTEVLSLLRLAAFAGSVVGLADYAFQRWQSTRKLRMTKQELKQEYRNSEGDPTTRGRRRSAHAKLTRNMMLSAVKDAQVIIVNPTHYSVALTYTGDGSAPRVVAKGTDELARQIREQANRHSIPIVESPPLARALHASVAVGDPIPDNFFEAVAIVLAFIMRPRRNRTAATARRVRVPASKIPAVAEQV